MPQKVKYDTFVHKYLKLLRAKTISGCFPRKALHQSPYAVNQNELLLPAKAISLAIFDISTYFFRDRQV